MQTAKHNFWECLPRRGKINVYIHFFINYIIFSLQKYLFVFVQNKTKFNWMLQNLKILYYFKNKFKVLPAQRAQLTNCQLITKCCLLLPRHPPTLFLYRSNVPLSVCTNISGTGTVVYWLLWNVLVLLISKCTAGDIN
jgi:hypothetical protein